MNPTEPIASSWLEPQIGFQLAHEQFNVPELVEFGIAADQVGFDLLAVSDHFQPWQGNEGHSGQAWITMSAIGQKQIGFGWDNCHLPNLPLQPVRGRGIRIS